MEKATQRTNELWRAILALKSPDEARKFFGDLLTEEEIVDISKRWRVARLLNAGASYQTIEKETDLSSRTIARISSWLQEGLGGYRMMLKRLGSHTHSLPHSRSG